MYLKYFKLSASPFSISPDPSFLYMSSQHQEALAHLLYGLEHGGGFVALTGEVGTGKTTLCRYILDLLPDSTELALILNPRLTPLELLATLCDELGADYSLSQSLSIKNLVDALNRHLLEIHAVGGTSIVLIDEAQNLSIEVLEQIRLLTNLETSEKKLLQMILVGQPELNDLLDQPSLRQLKQRITAHYHLSALNKAESIEYIRHRLNYCAADLNLFSQSALDAVFKCSLGVPRLINMICDRSLMGVYSLDSKQVSQKNVYTAANELRIRVTPHSPISVVISLVIALSGLLLFFLPTVIGINENTAVLYNSLNRESDLRAGGIEKHTLLLVNESDEATNVSFSTFLDEYGTDLPQAMKLLTALWSPYVSQWRDAFGACHGWWESGEQIDCLMLNADWKTLLSDNHPAVLVFSNHQGQEQYLVLKGLQQGNPVFFTSKEEKVFSLLEVLSRWSGRFYLLWLRPVKGVSILSKGMSGDGVVELAHRLEVIDGSENKSTLDEPTDFYGQTLFHKVVSFQRTHGLIPDGVAGPRTLVRLGYGQQANELPLLDQKEANR